MNNNQVSEAGAPAGAPRQRLTSSSHHILVVDEDSDTRLLYGFVLPRPGCFVEVAEDGAAAWEALQANRYDLLITEHEMPRLTVLNWSRSCVPPHGLADRRGRKKTAPREALALPAACSLTSDSMGCLNPHGPGQQLQEQVPERLPQVQVRRDIPHVPDIPRDRDILRRPHGPEKCSRLS